MLMTGEIVLLLSTFNALVIMFVYKSCGGLRVQPVGRHSGLPERRRKKSSPATLKTLGLGRCEGMQVCQTPYYSRKANEGSYLSKIPRTFVGSRYHYGFPGCRRCGSASFRTLR